MGSVILVTSGVSSARVVFGARLRQLRIAAGISQAELAHRLCCHRTLVNKIEHGARCATWDMARQCDELLDGGDTLCQLWPGVDNERLRSDRRFGPRHADARASVSGGVVAGSGPGLTAGVLANPVELVASGDVLRRGLDDLLDDGTPGRSVLDRLAARTDRHAVDAEVLPPSTLLTHLYRTLTDVDQIGRERACAAHRSLYTLIAHLAILSGNAISQMGDMPTAWAWFDTALTAADIAGHDTPRADVRALGASILLRHGRHRDALREARRARMIGGENPCLASVLTPMIEAVTLARGADVEGAHQAFELARGAWARIGPGQRRASLFGCPLGRLLFFEGRMLTELGDFDRARLVYRRALELYTEDFVMDRTLIRLDWARGLASSGSPDEAASLVTAAMAALSPSYRVDVLLRTAAEVVRGIPRAARGSPSVRTCAALLAELGTPDPRSPAPGPSMVPAHGDHRGATGMAMVGRSRFSPGEHAG